MSSHIKIFDIFGQFTDVAPKNWDEFDELVNKCYESGKMDVVDFLVSWKADMHYYMESEFHFFEHEFNEAS